MNLRFLAAIVVVVLVLAVLMYSAAQTSAKAVVTVAELLTEKVPRKRVQLGARVSKESEILVETRPERRVSFVVIDIGNEQKQLPVVYQGAMPDTLKQGRDVILQGSFDGSRFLANNLVTQCPSKYEPPMPGKKSGAEYGLKQNEDLGEAHG